MSGTGHRASCTRHLTSSATLLSSTVTCGLNFPQFHNSTAPGTGRPHSRLFSFHYVCLALTLALAFDRSRLLSFQYSGVRGQHENGTIGTRSTSSASFLQLNSFSIPQFNTITNQQQPFQRIHQSTFQPLHLFLNFRTEMSL